MGGHGYESGRLNLPFVGIATFGQRPYVADWDRIEADVAVLDAPFDMGDADIVHTDTEKSHAILAAQVLLNVLGFIFHARVAG